MKKIKKAYSLIELSIVITIIAIISTAILSMAIQNDNAKKAEITKKRMQRVYQELANYVMKNGKFPCPSGLMYERNNDVEYGTTTSCSDSDDPEVDGIYISSVTTNLIWGAVPTGILGLHSDYAQDAWGSKISYIIDINNVYHHAFADSPGANDFGVAAHDSGTKYGNITMEEKIGTDREIITDGIFVLISHGANKLGAFPNNSNIQNSLSSVADESSNHLPSSAETFDANFTVSTDDSNYDDIVLYKNMMQLIGDYPQLMRYQSCDSLGGNFDNNLHYYGQIVYSTSNCDVIDSGSVTGTRLTKKCEAFNKWVDIVGPSCPT